MTNFQKPVQIRFQLRSDTTARWAYSNPILRDGEPAYDTERQELRIGDGMRHYSDLDYFVPHNQLINVINGLIEQNGSNVALLEQALNDHILEPNPHPNYDNGSSFIVLYQNAKV